MEFLQNESKTIDRLPLKGKESKTPLKDKITIQLNNLKTTC